MLFPDEGEVSGFFNCNFAEIGAEGQIGTFAGFQLSVDDPGLFRQLLEEELSLTPLM
jgi:hypothetical protein